MIRLVIVVLLAAGCSHPAAPHEKVEIQLAPQPVIRNGVREIYTIEPHTTDVLARAVRTIRTRLQLAGIAGHVAVDGERLVVDLAPADPDTLERASELVRRTGHVEFRFVDTESPFMIALGTKASNDWMARAKEIRAGSDHWTTADAQRVTEWFLVAPDADRGVEGADARTLCPHMTPAPGEHVVVCLITGREAIEAYIAELEKLDPTLVVPADRELAFHEMRTPGAWRTYLLERTPIATGTSVKRATIRTDPETGSSFLIELDRSGTTAMSAAIASHPFHKLAIVIDGRVWATRIYGDSLPPVGLSITPRADEPLDDPDPRDMAILLTTGELPGTLTYLVRARLVDGVPRDGA